MTGPFDSAVFEGLKYDLDNGGKGWEALESQAASEDDVIALAYTSGTTAKPKGVEFTHRGCYLAALANIVESGLNYHGRKCHYLWTLPMFHAMGRYLLLCVYKSLLTLLRMDLPMGGYGSPRNALLPAED